MVTIISSSVVVPSEPTPKGSLWLSGSDQINPLTLTPSIYIYRPQPHHAIQSIVDTLKRSLSEILVHYYPLAGRLRSIGGGRVEADCNAMGVQFLQAESTKTIEDYADFKPNESIQELLPKVDYTKPIEQIPLMIVQLTRFSCGGICLGVANSHSLMDGVAAVHFIIAWAKLARGLKLEEHDMPFLDRTALRCRTPLMPPRYEHPEYKPLPLLLRASNTTEERKETTVELLKLTGEQVEKIKKKANEGMNDRQESTTRLYTRFEAITAHIWRCASVARQNDYNQQTTVRLVGDIRNRMKPPLPPNYFGNAILRTQPRNVTCGEVTSNPLSYTAQKIREAIELLREEEHIRSQLDFIESVEDVNSLRVAFHSLGCETAPFLGNPNMAIGSWVGMPVYDLDFGWGKPLYMGPAVVNVDGTVIIVPGSTDQDGSITIAICLQTAHMPDFKNFFYQDK